MASYLQRDLDRDELPAIVHPSSRRVAFDDDRHVRSRSPSSGLYGHRADSPLFQPRPPSPGSSGRWLQMQEVQDQVKCCRDEIQKKDALIKQLVSMESIPKVNVRSQADSIRLENLYMGDRQSLDAARSEVAVLQVKSEKMQNKLRELENELEIKDVKIKEMKLQNETCREGETRLTCVIESLRNQVADLEGRSSAFESVAGRSEYTVAALQRENKEAQERIVEVESRLRKQLEEREEAQARLEALDRKHKEFLGQFSSILRVESITGGIPCIEELTEKLSELVQDNAMLKGKILTLNETMKHTDLETKASRETIMRLVSEVGKEQQAQSRYSSESDGYRSRSREREDRRYLKSALKSPTRYRHRSLSRERDSEREERRGLDREVVILKERLEASQRTLEATKQELDLRDDRLSNLDRDYRSSTHNVRNASSQFTLFKEQLAGLLSDMDQSVHATEESILHRVESIMYQSRDWRTKLETLETRTRTVTEQLESQYELHKTAAHRARKAESDTSELHERLRSYEGELAAGDVMRDGFKSDKEQYMRALQQLGEVMRMDRISLDLGMDMTSDALISRAQQLVRLEKDTLADRSTQIYNLQRKVKSHKEQLESKDLHIDLLRKKITNLEEKILGKTTIERERDNETLRIRKVEKLAEKYKIQLIDARQENTNLKAQLLGASELRVRTMEQRKELEELTAQVEELTHLRKKQSRKIQGLKEEMDMSQHTTQEGRVVVDNAVQALSSELRTTKTALVAIQNREKQLVDFRNVVARMLGLDINTLAIPDYEIISRLEKLINAHHSHTFTTLSLEEALADMEGGFVSGYHDYRNTHNATESQAIRRSRERVKRKAINARSRSMSPVRRINPKVY